uniref:Pco131239 n=1 Tax=Arundo donax TaxID=35708 RepID=A0A0A9ED77_ARUDO
MMKVQMFTIVVVFSMKNNSLILGGTTQNQQVGGSRIQAFLGFLWMALHQSLNVNLDKGAGVRNAEFP